MFDLHSHILPGFDDGAKDETTALTMLKLAAESGTVGIVGSPHTIEGSWLPGWEKIKRSCDSLNRMALAECLNIKVFPGAEVAVNPDLLNILGGPGPYCINGGRYILIELPALGIPDFVEDFFFTLQTRGLIPILAHPERHPMLQENLNLLRNWLERGVLVQVNASSINGRMGQRVLATAKTLLIRGMVHCIGSDAHGVTSRRPILNEAYNKVISWIGTEPARFLFYVNPGEILNDQELELDVRPQISDGNWINRWKWWKNKNN